MYLSRIWLNPLRTGTQRMLRSPQVVHAAVLGGLPEQPVEERPLWRLETESPHRLQLLVLTRSLPSWEHVVEQGGWPSAEESQTLVRSVKPLLDRVERGREFAFRLRANPVSATRRPAKPSPAQAEQLSVPGARGVRVPHRTASHQLAWFLSRTASWGFDIPETESGFPDVLLTGRERISFTKGGDDGRHRVTLSTATFEGRLRVADVDLLRQSLTEGVGPARAYGCGLITLAPVSSRSRAEV